MRSQSKNGSANGTRAHSTPDQDVNINDSQSNSPAANTTTPHEAEAGAAGGGDGNNHSGIVTATSQSSPPPKEEDQGQDVSNYSKNNVKVEHLVAGCKVQALKDGQLRPAEILAIHTKKGKPVFYVHYQDYNKRLDEWVDTSHFDLSLPVEYPKPDKSKRSTPVASKAKSKDNKKKANKISKTKASGKENATPKEVSPQVGDDNDVMDLDKVNPQNGAVESLTRDEEIEKLRTGGSMTQNSHEVARIRNLQKIQMGKFEVEPWYFSPYPVELTEDDTVYICEFCLSYYGSKKQFERHRHKCQLYHPPGNEIYRDEGVSFFEIDGRRQRQWCRNLCLLSKLFLDHKTLYYDVDPFLFYCMTRRDHLGHHLIGYFSKEKESAEQYNVACILTLPQYQREGYGKLLIAFSYMLSKKEGKLGSPEKPLSDLGLLSYRAFWADTIVEYLVESKGEVTIDDIAQHSSMTTNDILHTLQHLNMLRYYKGQHIIVLTNAVIDHRERQKKRRKRTLDPTRLQWKPPVFTAAQLRFAW